MSLQGPHFSPQSTAKINDKAQIPGRIVSSGTSAVVFASVYSEKTHLKKFIMNKLQETMAFGGHQTLNSTMKQRPEK